VEGHCHRPLSGSSAFVNCVAILFCADLPDSRDAARCGLNGFGRERGAPRLDAPRSFLDLDRKRTRSFPKSPSRRSAFLTAQKQGNGTAFSASALAKSCRSTCASSPHPIALCDKRSARDDFIQEFNREHQKSVQGTTCSPSSRLARKRSELFGHYVKVRSIRHSNQSDIDRNSELTARRTEAVASYFEQKGISAKRLLLLDPGGAPYAFNEGAAKVQYLKNSEVLQLDFASETDSGTGPS
jgi:hypothetical protein